VYFYAIMGCERSPQVAPESLLRTTVLPLSSLFIHLQIAPLSLAENSFFVFIRLQMPPPATPFF
jgi:hypothetical protein